MTAQFRLRSPTTDLSGRDRYPRRSLIWFQYDLPSQARRTLDCVEHRSCPLRRRTPWRGIEPECEWKKGIRSCLLLETECRAEFSPSRSQPVNVLSTFCELAPETVNARCSARECVLHPANRTTA